MLLPPIVRRREMDRQLVEFFRDHRQVAFRRAIAEFCGFYHLRQPHIEWYEYIDWGKTAGKTFEDGRIHLVHPENWKRGRIYNSERMWVQTVYHELAHYLFWTDAESKAEVFTRRMVRGLRRPTRTRALAVRMKSASQRRAAGGHGAAAMRAAARRTRNDRASVRVGGSRGRIRRRRAVAAPLRRIGVRSRR